jgi:hypothetical protein
VRRVRRLPDTRAVPARVHDPRLSTGVQRVQSEGDDLGEPGPGSLAGRKLPHAMCRGGELGVRGERELADRRSQGQFHPNDVSSHRSWGREGAERDPGSRLRSRLPPSGRMRALPGSNRGSDNDGWRGFRDVVRATWCVVRRKLPRARRGPRGERRRQRAPRLRRGIPSRRPRMPCRRPASRCRRARLRRPPA